MEVTIAGQGHIKWHVNYHTVFASLFCRQGQDGGWHQEMNLMICGDQLQERRQDRNFQARGHAPYKLWACVFSALLAEAEEARRPWGLYPRALCELALETWWQEVP